LLVQTFDRKNECVGFYAGNELCFDIGEFPNNATATWNYAPYLREHNLEIVNLYLEGRKVEDVLPDYLKEDWEDVCHKISAYNRSFGLAKIDMEENCFYDLVPERLLVEWATIKNSITSYVLEKVQRPRRYDFYHQLQMLVSDIANQQVSLDSKMLRSLSLSAGEKKRATSLLGSDRRVKYNIFGTRTGRLTTKSRSFPILTLPGALRSAVLPNNDLFVELDFNGAEVRVLLGMLGEQQPTQDVHSYHQKEVFMGECSRDQAKTSFFAWLYGSRAMLTSKEGKKLESFYDKRQLLDKHWVNQTITTPFHKVMKDVDEHHALNYLVQSTAADLALKQFLKVHYYLRSKMSASCIAYMIHDSIVLDMRSEDMKYLKEICYLMGSTNFGVFPLNMKQGKTLGNMREFKHG
jgi:hypothetical protein